MRSVSKSKSASFYGVMLRLYPESFQRHYGATMEQTFDDMLDDQQSWLGRLGIWTRTLADLPFSATKEHLTDGKEVFMTRNMKLVLVSAVVAVLVSGAGSYWFGILHARGSTDIAHVSVSQLGDAMQQDSFYSQYGNAALLFSAQVSALTQTGDTTSVTFATQRPYSVTCEFKGSVSAKAGQTLSVVAPGGSAERRPHGVLLHKCVQN